ncbi:MAG TPA: hypothetical protein VG055_11935 [Planctomycetaceae bacterium]|nr:hypothetical protein [Planctomycetaceae bacterium]
MRRTLFVAGLATLGAVLWLHATWWEQEFSRDRGGSTDVAAILPGAAYAVDVDRDQAVLDLDFQPNSRYVVVISSLAPSTGGFAVAASSQTIGSPEFPPRRLTPLESTIGPTDSSMSPPSKPPSASSAAALTSAQAPRPILPLESSRQPKTDTASLAGAARTFALHVTDGSLDDPHQYAKVAAREVAVGRSVRVYLDDQQSLAELAPGLVRSIAELFDNELIPRFRDVFGTYRDVDGDGRFSVLLSPWLARLQGGRTSIGGFVRGSDFQPFIAAPFSNRCDMMYVNSQTIPGPHLRTLLIHEYTHAVSFSRRTAGQPGKPAFPEEEDWLNEALAHCAESLFDGGWTNLDYRISRYLNDTAAYPLVVEDYYRAGLWRCHGCRGATYLFLRYCVERFGTQTLTRLVATRARGTRNLELATGCSFERLFRDWTLSLLESKDPGSITTSPDTRQCAMRTQGANRGRLANLDLCGPLGAWGLAGPRRRKWQIDSGPMNIELKGTSAAFVELSASGKAGLRRIHLVGTRGMQLQVSFVQLLDDLPRVEVEAAWSPQVTASAAAEGRGNEFLHIVARVRSDEDLVIEQIAAEQNAGEDHVPLCFSGDSFKSIEVSEDRQPDAPTSLEQGSRSGAPRARRFELPGKQFLNAACPVIVKVVAVDRKGRRAADWTTVPALAPRQVVAITPARR